MKSVTRDIDPRFAQDLLERVPRACLSFADKQGPQLQPVLLRWQTGRYLVGISADTLNLPEPGQEAVLLVDEGIYYFDLRAIYIRGQVQSAEASLDAQTGFIWFELIPNKTVAWDYGSMREVDS